jgi:hypothetical protein
VSRHAERTADPRRAGFERMIARDDIARAEGRKTASRGDAYGTPALRTMCGSCTLSLSAFPNRRAFDAHRLLCERTQ